MLSLLAILFPLLVGVLIYPLMPFDVDEYLSKEEKENIEFVAWWPGFWKEFGSNLTYLLMAFLSAFVLWFVQKVLFSASHGSENYLFIYRATDIPIYPFIPGLLLGLCLSASIVAHFVKRKGFEYVRKWLLSGVKGATGYENVKYYKPLVLALSIAMTFINILAFNTFIAIEGKSIVYSGFLNPRSVKRELADISCINIYCERMVRGRACEIKNLEIVFKDGVELDTYYLLEGRNIDNFTEALRNEIGKDILIFNVSGHNQTKMFRECVR